MRVSIFFRVAMSRLIRNELSAYPLPLAANSIRADPRRICAAPLLNGNLNGDLISRSARAASPRS